MSIRKIAVGVAALVTIGIVPAGPAHAAPGTSGQHCVVHVTGQKPTGELTVSSPRCYSTFAGAMKAENVGAWGDGASARAGTAGVARLSFTLATHYDLANLNPAGGSTSTVGSSCSGGWLNASAAWNNRISSTSNGCPNVVHYDGFNLTGGFEITTGGGGNLSALNNKTSSIQYT